MTTTMSVLMIFMTQVSRQLLTTAVPLLLLQVKVTDKVPSIAAVAMLHSGR